MQYKKQKNKGAAILIAVLFFVIISMVMVIGIASSTTREYITAREFQLSKKAFYLAEAGVEDAMYRIRRGDTVTSPLTLSLDGVTATTVITDVSPSEKTIVGTASINGLVRKVSATLTKLTPVSFNYGAQVGDGGLTLQNSSRVNGDVYASGPIVGVPSSSVITGAVFSVTKSATPGGSVYGIMNQGTNRIYAGSVDPLTSGSGDYKGNVSHSTAGGEIYCSTITNSSSSTCEPLYVLETNSQNTKRLPLKDIQVTGWKTAAASGGTDTANCMGAPPKYTVSSSILLGPKKIPCDLEIVGNKTLTLTGAVWIEGNIILRNQAKVNVDTSLGAVSVPLIADPDTTLLRETKGTIKVETNTVSFNVGGNPNAQVLLLSWNTGATVGNGVEAISMENTVDGNVIAYAGYGEIELANNAEITNAVGYKITLKNNAKINYTAQLQDMFVHPGATALAPWSIYNLREVP